MGGWLQHACHCIIVVSVRASPWGKGFVVAGNGRHVTGSAELIDVNLEV